MKAALQLIGLLIVCLIGLVLLIAVVVRLLRGRREDEVVVPPEEHPSTTVDETDRQVEETRKGIQQEGREELLAHFKRKLEERRRHR